MRIRRFLFSKFSGVIACVLALTICVGLPSLAQITNGRISGTVMDTSRAAIVGATVTVTDESTGQSRTMVTNDQGFYVVTNLPVGSYRVTAEQQGFAKLVKSGYALDADGRVTVDFELKPGKVTETVEVAATGELVNTVSGEVSHVVNSEQVLDTALNGRNYIQLVTLIPGVALLNEDQMDNTTSLSATKQSINGANGNQNLLTVDGGFDLDSGSNGSQINNVGIDFIEEVSIKTSNFSAEYGRQAGSAINVVTRRGGDRFHGGVLEFLRNDELDATNYFSPVKQKLRFNDFGWNFGGPIKRNKLFFFAGEEWKRIRQDADPTRRTLPTSAELRGDFSGSGGKLNYPGTTTPIPGRNIASLMTPDGKAIAALYSAMAQQAASFANTPNSNNSVYQNSQPFNWREDIIRGDYTINDHQSIFVRYLHDYYEVYQPTGYSCSSDLPTCTEVRLRPGTSYQLSHTWLMTPTLVNEAHVNASWNGQRVPPVGDAWKRSTYGFVFPQIFANGGGGRFRDSIPDITWGGSCGDLLGANGQPVLDAKGKAVGRGCPSKVGGQSHSLLSPTTDIAFSETLTWSHGEHTLKAGALVVRNRKDQNSRSPYAGLVRFDSNNNTSKTTGNALADALLGNFQDYQEATDDPLGLFRYTQYHAFAMDSWKVTRNLSLELGARWEHRVPSYTTGNNFANFDPSLYDPAQAVTVTTKGTIDATKGGNPLNGIIRAGSGVPSDQLIRVPNGNSLEVLAVPAGAPRGLYDVRDLFAPRVGFSWAPFSDGKTAIRGGFGIFYDTVEGNMDFPELGNPPFAKTVDFRSGSLSNPAGGTSPAAGLISIKAIDPHLKIPYAMNYSLSVEHELPRGVFVQLGYVGSQMRHLVRNPDINQPSLDALFANAALPSGTRPDTNYLRPYKGYSSIRMFMSDAIGNYNSFQSYVSKRKGNLTLTASYTWSKNLSDMGTGSGITEDGGSDNIAYAVMRHYSYGPASSDRSHVFVTTYSYSLPSLRGSSGLLRNTLGGWEFSGITRAQTGQALTVTGTATGSPLGQRRADYVGGPIYVDNPTPDHWFNTAAFAPAPDTRLGNTSVGFLRGPALYYWDLSLRKMFYLPHEGWTLRFQADLFNAFNRTNFRNPSTNVTGSSYGAVSSAGPERNIQFGLKFAF